jgi:hypothetical protein
MEQRSWTMTEPAARHRGERQEPPAKPTNHMQRAQGCIQDRRRSESQEQGLTMEKTVAARGTPAQNHRRQRPKGPHRARQKDPCVPDPETHQSKYEGTDSSLELPSSKSASQKFLRVRTRFLAAPDHLSRCPPWGDPMAKRLAALTSWGLRGNMLMSGISPTYLLAELSVA